MNLYKTIKSNYENLECAVYKLMLKHTVENGKHYGFIYYNPLLAFTLQEQYDKLFGPQNSCTKKN